MASKTLNSLLLLVTIGFGIWFANCEVEFRSARAHLDTLVDKYGPHKIENPDKFFVKQVLRESNADFAWRIHCPKPDSWYECEFGSTNRGVRKSVNHALSEQMVGSMVYDDVYRCQFIFKKDIVSAHVSIDYSPYNDAFHFEDELTVRFLKQHFDDLEINVLGSREPVTAVAGSPLVLLNIGIPTELREQMKAGEFTPLLKQFADSDLFQLRLGTQIEFIKLRIKRNAEFKAKHESLKAAQNTESGEQP